MKALEPLNHLLKGKATDHDLFVIVLEFTALTLPFILIFANYLS